MKKEGKVPVELVKILQDEGIYIWKETLDGGVVQCGECKNNVLISNHVSKCPLCLAKGEWVDGESLLYWRYKDYKQIDIRTLLKIKAKIIFAPHVKMPDNYTGLSFSD